MGLTMWTFVRTEPGELRSVALRAVEAFMDSTGRLPVADDGFVRYAQVVVRLENRRAIEVVQIGFHRHRALADGTLDREGFDRVLALIAQATSSRLPPPGEGSSSLVPAEHRFAQRQLDHVSHWEPTEGDLSRLRALVNQKAGAHLL